MFEKTICVQPLSLYVQFSSMQPKNTNMMLCFYYAVDTLLLLLLRSLCGLFLELRNRLASTVLAAVCFNLHSTSLISSVSQQRP